MLLLPEPTSWLRPQAIEVVGHLQAGVEYRREDTPRAMLRSEVCARLAARPLPAWEETRLEKDDEGRGPADPGVFPESTAAIGFRSNRTERGAATSTCRQKQVVFADDPTEAGSCRLQSREKVGEGGLGAEAAPCTRGILQGAPAPYPGDVVSILAGLRGFEGNPFPDIN